MKIGFLSLYSGKVNRGVETVVNELSTRLAKNHEVFVFEAEESKKKNYQIKKIKIDIDWTKKDMTNTLRRKFFLDYWSRKTAIFTLKAIFFIVKNKFDIVMTFNGGWQPVLMKIASLLYGFKLVTSGQSGIGWDDRVNLLVFPNCFVPISTKAFHWARKVNPLVKSIYIPNGVDLNKFKSSGEKLKTALKEPIVLCVGALTLQKRIDLVIKAVAKISNVNLLIVGAGNEKENLKALAEDLLGKRAAFLELSHSQMPKVYRACQVFCLVPETSEAFGIVYIEAMASNLGVVAIDDEQRREIVGEAGILVKKPEDLEELAKGIKLSLSKKWDNKPRREAQKFDWEAIAKKYEELFLDL